MAALNSPWDWPQKENAGLEKEATVIHNSLRRDVKLSGSATTTACSGGAGAITPRGKNKKKNNIYFSAGAGCEGNRGKRPLAVEPGRKRLSDVR